jgi:hypothetical protein
MEGIYFYDQNTRVFAKFAIVEYDGSLLISMQENQKDTTFEIKLSNTERHSLIRLFLSVPKEPTDWKKENGKWVKINNFEILLMIAANVLHYIKSRLQPKRKRVERTVEPEQPYMRYVTRNKKTN